MKSATTYRCEATAYTFCCGCGIQLPLIIEPRQVHAFVVPFSVDSNKSIILFLFEA